MQYHYPFLEVALLVIAAFTASGIIVLGKKYQLTVTLILTVILILFSAAMADIAKGPVIVRTTYRIVDEEKNFYIIAVAETEDYQNMPIILKVDKVDRFTLPILPQLTDSFAMKSGLYGKFLEEKSIAGHTYRYVVNYGAI